MNVTGLVATKLEGEKLKDLATTELGIEAAFTRNFRVGLSYLGAYGSNVKSNGVKKKSPFSFSIIPYRCSRVKLYSGCTGTLAPKLWTAVALLDLLSVRYPLFFHALKPPSIILTFSTPAHRQTHATLGAAASRE